jgi:hypothetical protein
MSSQPMMRTIETQGHGLACTGTRKVWQWEERTRVGYVNLRGHVWSVVTGYGERGVATLQEDLGEGRADGALLNLKLTEMQKGLIDAR